ncbi:MAG TPA: hypothetical protein VL916_00340 [Ilumatobacteraceae bacterium]|nr:hypothetical protein [Ilumatobacteraceae bacterium]
MIRTLLRWWPVPATIVTSLLLQRILLESRYDVGGHAAEHLSGASAPFAAAALCIIVLWATPGARRQVEVLGAMALWFAATVLVLIGNVRVVDDLIDAGYAFTPTSSVPDVADHSIADMSVWIAVVASIVMVLAFRRRGHIGTRVTVGAVIASALFPPWIFPGLGAVVLLVARCIAHGKAMSRPGLSKTELARPGVSGGDAGADEQRRRLDGEVEPLGPALGATVELEGL